MARLREAGRPVILRRVLLLYTLLIYAATPLLLLVFLCRKGWRTGLRQRLGWVPATGAVNAWVHAASVGEVQAARELIEALLQRGAVFVTTNTPTGAEQVRTLFGTRVGHAYAPLDLPGSLRRFLQRVQPSMAVVLETELWPNRFRALRDRGIPVVIVNGRLSPRSMAGYGRWPRLIARTLEDCSHIAAQTDADAQRFRRLGAPPERLTVTGNLKFDLAAPTEQRAAGAALRTRLGRQRPVWIAASTREGEEAEVLHAHRQLLEVSPAALLLLVPRHPTRFDEVARLLLRSGLRWARRTELPDEPPAALQVLLGDTLGELHMYYEAADVAFVGGSLVPLGGQNVLEPAALARPVVVGPHVFNFHEACVLLEEAGGLRRVPDAAALAREVHALLTDSAQRERQGQAAAAAVAANRGAHDRVLELLARVQAGL